MSTASKVTLATTIVSSIALISFVHTNQKAEQAVMHDGVLRDMQQQKLRAERQADFDMQKALEAEYRKEQNVKDSTEFIKMTLDEPIDVPKRGMNVETLNEDQDMETDEK